MNPEGPRLELVRLYGSAPDIIKASSNSAEQVSLRARRGCGPLNVATGLGWIFFSPIDFELMWDGSQIYCQISGEEDWIKVDRMFLPGFRVDFEEAAPMEAHPSAPLFLEAFPEPGVVQIWSGYSIATPPGWGAWIRSPINQPKSNLFETFDAFIETDWWRGGLITNIRINKTDVPIGFRRHVPLAQIIPIPIDLVESDKCWLSDRIDIDDAADEFWGEFVENSQRLNSQPVGSYIRALKLRRRGT